MRQPYRIAAAFLLLSGPLFAPRQLSPTREATGNTDGVLVWELGTIAPGQSAREVALFAHGGSYDDVVERLEDARRQFAEPSEPPMARTERDSTVWIDNQTSDFALQAPGWLSSQRL